MSVSFHRNVALSSSKPILVVFLLLAGCLGLLALRGGLFPSRLASPEPTPEPASPEVLTLYYHERRPLYHREGGRLTGLVVERAVAALERAGLAARWVPIPPARQLELIQQGAEHAAAIGWIATEERRRFARFSDPLYQDGVFVALVRHDEERLRDGQPLEQALADPRLTLLVKDAYSYGAEVDALILRHNPRRLSTPSPNDAMLRMLSEGRADYFLLAHEEAVALLNLSSAERHRLVQFERAPRGVVRHLMFSRRVPESVVHQFNTAWRELQRDYRHP